MTTLFTEIDLIRYVYGESTDIENTEIENAAICDAALQEEIFNIKFDITMLNKLSFNPSDFVIKKILDFSTHFSARAEL